MTTAGLADVLTILIAAILSFTLVDLIKRKRNARIYLFVTGLWSLLRLALPFGPAPKARASAQEAPPQKLSRQAQRQAKAAQAKGKRR